MSSPAINTVIKMMESLSEDKQDKIVEHLQEYIQDLQHEQKWHKSFNKSQDKLIADVNLARQQMTSKNINLPEIQKKLDCTIQEIYISILQEFLTRFREFVAKAIADLKRTEQTHDRYQSEYHAWELRRQAALVYDNKMLASQAFELQKSLTTRMLTLKNLGTQQTDKVNSLKYHLIKLENNIDEIKTERYAYHTSKRVMKTKKELQKIIDSVYSKKALEVLDITKDFLLDLEEIRNRID